MAYLLQLATTILTVLAGTLITADDTDCNVTNSWFSILNDSFGVVNCSLNLINDVTEMTLNIATGNEVNKIVLPETENKEAPQCHFQTVSHVTVLGKLFNDSSSLSSCLPRLSHVTLSRAAIGQLTRHVIDTLGSSQLERLDLSGNDVTSVTPGAFDSRHSVLQVIDLSGNQLTVIDNETFVDLFSLTSINLSHNAIYRIERTAFYTTQFGQPPLGNLSENGLILKTSSEKFDIKDHPELDAWPALETIDLRHNIISELDELVFRGPLSNIRKLLLSHNRISSLPRYIIDQLHQLIFIDLAHNDLVWLDVGAFSSASLRHIDLSHNALRKLVSMTFLYLPCIIDIDLSYNKINQVYKYAFYRLCKPEDSLDVGGKLVHDPSTRQVNISLRANLLETDVIFQMMTLFEQQQESDVGSGCSLRTDLRDNRIQYLLDPAAAAHLNRQDSSWPIARSQPIGGVELHVDLDGNDIQCDCRLVTDLATFDKISSTSRPSLVANPARWRTLNCSAPELFVGFTVAEFAAYSLCPTNTQQQQQQRGDEGERYSDEERAGHLIGGKQSHRIRVAIGNQSVLLSAMSQRNSNDDEITTDTEARHSTATSGGRAALVALLLCAAALALVGGLLFKRGGGTGAEMSLLRRVSNSSGRRRCDVFVVYSVEDEAWVTGTLLDIIYTRYPRYGVLLQHHVDPVFASWYTHQKKRRNTGGNWSRVQLVLNSCMDSCSMTLVVVSEQFFNTVWNLDSFRSLLLSKLETQRHRFMLVCLGHDVISEDMQTDRKQFFENSSAYTRLEATDRHFASHLIDHLPVPSGRCRFDSQDTEESVALISEDDGFNNERY